MANEKFEVKIALAITTAEGDDFADYELNYHGLSYEGLQALQRALAETLLGLGDARLAPVAKPGKK